MQLFGKSHSIYNVFFIFVQTPFDFITFPKSKVLFPKSSFFKLFSKYILDETLKQTV